MANKNHRFLILICVMAVRNIATISMIHSDTYKAGVVEYHPSSGSLIEAVEKNLGRYLEIIINAGLEDVDILVFPEATLNRDGIYGEWDLNAAIEVPSKEENATPCDEKGKYAEILEKISCAASVEKMYIVINVGEKAYCPKNSNNKCKEGDKIFFNTNVVFDRKGTIISKYRKINLYGESGFIESLDNSYEVFDTDFNVTFGHFICFDLLFQQPAVQIVEKGKVFNVIFPTMWFSELPSLTAVEIQESYAFTHNVNFLVAGANNPIVGSTGSGIYSGYNGALNVTMRGVNETTLLTSELDKIPIYNITPQKIVKNKKDIIEMDHLFLTSNNMKAYKHESLNLSQNQQTIQLFYGNSSCIFNIKINSSKQNSTLKHYQYKAIMFNGVRSFRFKNGGIFECLIVACTSTEFSSCARRFPNYSEVEPIVEFSNIEINASVPTPFLNISTQSSNSVYSPITLKTDITPLAVNDFKYKTIKTTNEDMQLIHMTLENSQTELLSFGVFGRIFSNDHLPVTSGTI